MYLLLKSTHTAFAMRGYWKLSGSALARHRLTRIAPHVIDALFLATGVALIVEIDLAVLQNTWLLAKFAGLVFYVGLGMIAMRFGRTPQVRLLAFVGAVAAFAYIVGAAVTKSPWSWIAL